MANYVIPVNSSRLAKAGNATPEWIQFCSVVGGGLVAFVATCVWAVYWLNPNENVVDAQLWFMFVSQAIFLLGAIFTFPADNAMLSKDHHPISHEVTKIYNELNDGHKDMAREAVLRIYEIEKQDTKYSEDHRAMNRRLDAVKALRAKEIADTRAMKIDDNSDLMALETYVKGVDKPALTG